MQATMGVDDRYEPLGITSTFSDGSCDGAFIIGTQLDVEAVDRIRAGKCPVVLVDGYSAGDYLDSVVTDNVTGGRAAVEYLIAAGHHEIAMLGTEPGCYPSMLARREGYVEAIDAHGLRTHLIDTDYVLADTTALLGLDYVKRHPEVTAVFGANDLIAATFMHTAWRLASRNRYRPWSCPASSSARASSRRAIAHSGRPGCARATSSALFRAAFSYNEADHHVGRAGDLIT